MADDDQSEGDQGRILDALQKTLGDAKRIETHISILFVAPDLVLKIKRAVRLSFLDYATLEQRRQACEAELAINRRFTSDLYRAVVPITRTSQGVAVGGSGPAIEWAVEMARFDETRALDHLAPRGHIDGALADRLAEMMRQSHQRAERCDGAPWADSLARVVDRNIQELRRLAPVARDDIDRLDRMTRARLTALRPVLAQRAAAGFVRRCHGDAHLGNIVLIDDRPVLFDAIEFDAALATTDVLYDLAFPLMDLLHFGLAAPANRLLNAYVAAGWQDVSDGLQLLPLFLSLRAAIRSIVHGMKAAQAVDAAQSRADAAGYFDLALALLQPARPCLVAVGGKSGTGKSVLARDIAGDLPVAPGAILLRSDTIRKELFGVDPLQKLPPSAYEAPVTARVYALLLDRARRTLDQGFSAVIDAAFLKDTERSDLADMARDSGIDFRPVFLDADLAVRLERIRSRRADASDADSKVAAAQDTFDMGQLDWPVIDASGSREDTLARSRPHVLR